MDSKLLLVKVITLLFKEAMLSDGAGTSSAIVNEIIDGIKLPDAGVDFDRSRESLIALRTTAKWMLESEDSKHIDQASLLQRIRVNVGADDWLYEAFRQGIEGSYSEEQLQNQIKGVRRELQEFTATAKITEIMKKATHRLMFNPDSVPSIRDFVRDVAGELDPFISAQSAGKVEGEIDSVDLDDPESVYNLMLKGHAQTSKEGIMRLGYQGLNRMMGVHSGIKRGEAWVVGALQHQFKSGFIRNMFKHIALYNVPWMMDPKRKPCLVLLSLEDELPAVIMWYYVNLMENETGEACDISALHLLSPEEQKVKLLEMSQYVISKLQANGYHIKMKRLDPSAVAFHDVFDYINGLEAEGFEIHGCFIDYLAMMSKRGLTQGPMGSEIRDLWRRFRNFLSAKAITLVSPHQLSPAAKQLVRGNVEDLVKEVAGKGYYDGCSTIDQEVDGEIYIHKVKVNGAWYLTVQRGKHRGLIQQTPEKDLYFVIPFNDIGGIRDDINGPDTSSKHAGAQPGGGDQKPWFS